MIHMYVHVCVVDRVRWPCARLHYDRTFAMYMAFDVPLPVVYTYVHVHYTHIHVCVCTSSFTLVCMYCILHMVM